MYHAVLQLIYYWNSTEVVSDLTCQMCPPVDQEGSAHQQFCLENSSVVVMEVNRTDEIGKRTHSVISHAMLDLGAGCYKLCALLQHLGTWVNSGVPDASFN